MGEVAVSATGLLPKLCSLLNNCTFSDVEFSFDSEEGRSEKLYGHKLILALRSEYFASLFYKCGEEVHQVKIPASKKGPFYLMLKFLYTDAVQFRTVKEAEELYAIAEQYCVKELKDKCLEYLMQEKITIENVLPKYECALSKKVEKLLNDCRAFVCHDTRSVFKSAYFSGGSFAVIEDILTQDKLSVPTELEVIFAIMLWAKAECKRRRMASDDRSLRHCIEPFLKHLRFLSLTLAEFESFLQQYDIFSGYESNLITKKLLIPNSNINMPEYICCISAKRGTKISYGGKSLDADLLSNSEKFSMPERMLVKTVGSLQKLQDRGDLQNNAMQRQSRMISYQIKRVTPSHENHSPSHLKTTKFCSSPNVLGNPANNVQIKQSHSGRRNFIFELSESPRDLRSSFYYDIECFATFKMKSGSIKLFGFELSIKHQKESEELNVGVTLKGFVNSSSESYNKVLNKGTLTVMFPKPAVLKENGKGELEVTIDQLILNRCYVCSRANQLCEINNGLNCVCTISVNSNYKLQNNDGVMFLINRLFYTTA